MSLLDSTWRSAGLFHTQRRSRAVFALGASASGLATPSARTPGTDPHSGECIEKAARESGRRIRIGRGARRGSRHRGGRPHIDHQAAALPRAHRYAGSIGVDEVIRPGEIDLMRLRWNVRYRRACLPLHHYLAWISSPGVQLNPDGIERGTALAEMSEDCRRGVGLQHPLRHKGGSDRRGCLRIPPSLCRMHPFAPRPSRVLAAALSVDDAADVHTIRIAQGTRVRPSGVDEHPQRTGSGVVHPALPRVALARSTLRCSAANRSTTSPESSSSSTPAGCEVSPPSILACTSASTASL